MENETGTLYIVFASSYKVNYCAGHMDD